MIQDTNISSYEKLKRGDLRLRLLALYATRLDMTDKEAEKLTGIHASTISGLRRPLVRLEWVGEGGKRQCAATQNKVIAWKLTGKGLDYLKCSGAPHPQPAGVMPSREETNDRLL